MLSLAAVAAAFTLGLRDADQVAQEDPAAKFQLATDFLEFAHGPPEPGSRCLAEPRKERAQFYCRYVRTM